MNQRFSTNFGVVSFFVDWVVAFSSLYLLRLLLATRYQLGSLESILKFNIFIFPTIWVLFFFFFSIYDGKQNLKVIDEFSRITSASFLTCMTLIGFMYLTDLSLPRLFFLFYIFLTFLMMIIWRVIARVLYRSRVNEKGYHQKVLIVGAGEVGIDLRERIAKRRDDSISFVGFLDDSPEKLQSNAEVIGSVDTVKEIVARKKVTNVIIALPLSAHEQIDFVTQELEKSPVRVSIIPSFYRLSENRMTLSVFAGIPMLDIREPALSEYQRITKRIFDVIVTLLLLIPLLPVMAIVSFLVLIVDGPPILFIQNRVGENGHIIKVLKFRTMYPDSNTAAKRISTVDEQGHPIYKTKEDPRVTPLGRFLRRFSLDELPQFFNVLRGTLSLVGPRPELPFIVEKYEHWQRARLSVPQGVTGWWQIQGRSDKPLHLNIEQDLYYIQHYSLWLDISIIIKTIWIVLRGKGAY
jgi:exopolysaccharide biosynthesis polyprenyl glycosylphosphotransferase